MQIIYQVLGVSISPEKNRFYQINAVGQVPTGGWTNPTLVARTGVVGRDGSLDYDFMAEPPKKGTFVTQAFEEHRAIGQINGSSTEIRDLKQIRVYGHKGFVTVAFKP